MDRPLVLLHGYSDDSDSYKRWIKELKKRGVNADLIHQCDYESLTNEITIKDLAEGFDRAIRLVEGLKDGEPFDAIVHSTGMLVLRTWLTGDAQRWRRLKHVIALAPASFGSPLAHKGRSWLGSIFKGRKKFGPDFLEAGDLILDGLELGSPFTWDLAHKDLLCEHTTYDESPETPYVFIFCGTRMYRGFARLISEDGTDGTVRLAGCPLNTRKIILDLRHDDAASADSSNARIQFGDWPELDMSLVPIKGQDHGTILSRPTSELVDMAVAALRVEGPDDLKAWYETEAVQKALTYRDEGLKKKWQQFIIHAVDERGDAIRDYNVQFYATTGEKKEEKRVSFDLDVHVYRSDPSFRVFQVDLQKLDKETFTDLEIRLIASSGTQLVGYTGHLKEAEKTDAHGQWSASLTITSLLSDAKVNFFHPFTTTLVELRLNREPLPLNPNRALEIVRFD